MDPDDVARLMVKELKLTPHSDRGQTLMIDNDALKIGEQCMGSCLVAKLFSPKAINRVVFITQFPRILQANKHIEIGALGDNLFLLDFKSLLDRKRALSGGPWNIFRNLVVFREPHGLQSPSTMNFDDISIWVQCYNMPLVLMHKDFLVNVGNQIGVVEEIDTRENGVAMGRFARIRVRLDITKLLKKYIRLSISSGDEDVIVLLSYERLPDYCYNCGLIGHPFRDCETEPEAIGKLSYGSWMKATLGGGGRGSVAKSKTQKASP